jgi:hypothetical protein
MVMPYRLSAIFALLIASFGFVGCSGLVSAGTNGNPSPTTLAIASVQAACPTGSSCQIAWTTNVPADSTVAYGSSTSYGFSTPVDSAMVTSHQITLSGLAADTTYYYQVSSTDSKGNNGRSGGHSVKTSAAPSITTQPVSQTVTAGQTASFSVAATGTAPMSYQWNRNGTTISGATSSGYTTPATTSSDNGAQFAVVVSNTLGSATSIVATLTVNAATVAPSITAQPTSQTVTAGQAASFSVAATGTAPLSYQWQKNSVAISGATSSSYTTPATTTLDSGSTFRVLVSNSAGTVTSAAATLTVNAVAVPPSITTQPASQTVTAGQAATFSVTATGTAPISYQWRKNGTAISGASSASYTTPATTASDSGSQFTVVVSNSAGSATSNAAALTVNAATVAPSITTQPASQTVTAGQTASFSVAATGTAPLSYQWQKNGANIPGASSSNYTTPLTTSSDSGAQFTVVVSNTAGSVNSSAATLTVNAATVAPSITAQPTSQTVTAGQAASFSVAATGTAPLSYQWQKNGANIAGATTANYSTPATTTSDSGSTFRVLVSNIAGTVTSSAATLIVNTAAVAPSITTQPTSQTVTAGQPASFSVAATGTTPLSYQWQKNGVAISGATSSSYTTPATTSSDNGAQFTVAVSNTAGSVTSNAATLTVNAAAVAPSITTQPASQTVTAGQTASFSVAVTGTAPLSYQWQKNGVNIAGATSSNYTTPATTTSDSGSMFGVVVSNSAGTVTSAAAALTVNAATVAPSITTQPTSQTVTAGQTASFSVAATGTAPLSYQWQKNGVNIAGATSSNYTTPATTTSDSGSMFRVVVSNSAGTVTSAAAALTVNAATVAPSITTQPTSQTVTAGQTASFSVVATGTAPLSYQWQKNGVPISGATSSSYTTPATTSSDNGAQFTVAVTNTAATVTSNTATLTVNAVIPPAFTVWVAPSLDRVGKTDAPGTVSSISLSSARGETVDTQVVLRAPSSGLTNVNLSASPLSGPGGATIPASNITLYREYYLSVIGTASYGGGSNPPLGSGTYPEPLIPFNDPETGAPLCGSAATLKACNASVSAGQNQPYWIDISVPRGATNSPPGTYTGSISISSAQGNATIPVTLTVWNFELPVQPSELSLWTGFSPNSGNTVTTLAQALMRNKVMGWYDAAANASSDITSFGLNRSGLDNYYYIGIQCNGSYSSIPSTSQINAAAANFPAGLGLDFYIADELNGCTSDYTSVRTMAANAHAANRSVKTIFTLNTPDSNLYGAIDHWVLLDSLQQWPALPFTGGGDLWTYTSCNTGFGNTPEWLVDYPPINERIQAGFLNWTQGATGILYYRADGWTAGNTIGSWNNVDTTACGGGFGRPGDGIFLYPPGPIASTESAPGIRLKAIRDGIQDYEYAQILKNLAQVPFVNSVLQPIATSWTNWTHDPNALESARQQLGQLLHQLAP